jgi:hypothetical protein
MDRGTLLHPHGLGTGHDGPDLYAPLLTEYGQFHQDKIQALYYLFQRIKEGIPAPGSKAHQNLLVLTVPVGHNTFSGNKKGPSPRALF